MGSQPATRAGTEAEDGPNLPELLKGVLPDVLKAGAYHASLQVLAWHIKEAFQAEAAYVFEDLSITPPVLLVEVGTDPTPDVLEALKNATQREARAAPDRFIWTESVIGGQPTSKVILQAALQVSEGFQPVLVLAKPRFSPGEKRAFADLVELISPALSGAWSRDRLALEVRDAKRLVHDSKAEQRAKSAFLSRMSHDLRTPLSSVLGFAQLLEMEPLTSTQAGFVNRILSGGRQLLGLINRVLELTTVDSGKITLQMQAVKLSSVIKKSVDAIRPEAKEKGLQVHVDVAEELVALTDLGRFEQILANLLSNAIKFNSPGGLVSVNASRVSQGAVQVQVADNGPGIPRSQIPRLFEPFDRLNVPADVEGAGLGLAVSRALANALGGSLNAESRIGRGSVFTVELPAGNARGQPQGNAEEESV